MGVTLGGWAVLNTDSATKGNPGPAEAGGNKGRKGHIRAKMCYFYGTFTPVLCSL